VGDPVTAERVVRSAVDGWVDRIEHETGPEIHVALLMKYGPVDGGTHFVVAMLAECLRTLADIRQAANR
jgi:hypothetical protein